MILQTLLVNREEKGEAGKAEVIASRLYTRSNIKVAKLQIFNRNISKVLEFLMACRLYIRIKMRNVLVKEQVQWILLYVVRCSSQLIT